MISAGTFILPRPASLPLELQVLVRRRVQVADDETQARVRHAWSVAVQKRRLEERGEQDPPTRAQISKTNGAGLSLRLLSLPCRYPVSPTSLAAAIPARAHASSLSDTSPEIPTAPITDPLASRISTPPAAGTTRPCDMALSAEKKACCWGCSATRRASVREPTPIPSAPQAFPMAIWG